MKGALTDKIVKAFREGRLVRKAAPYVWLCLGFSFVVRLWCRTRKTVPGKIVFDNFHGKGFGDHQKYIALELLRRGFRGEMVWFASDAEAVRYRRRFYGCGKVELFGHPRNDVLFGESAALRQKVAADAMISDYSSCMFDYHSADYEGCA